MSGDGRPALEIPRAQGLRVGVVATSWHGEITDTLLERARLAGHPGRRVDSDGGPGAGCHRAADRGAGAGHLA